MDESGSPETITSDDVNGYLRETSGLHVTAKNFRTWGGTILADMELREMGPAPNEREATRNINRAIDVVAERLGNTRTVCRKYYVHPALARGVSPGLDCRTLRECFASKGPTQAACRCAAAGRGGDSAVSPRFGVT